MRHEVRPSAAPIRLPIDVCHIEILLSLRQACDVVTGISERWSRSAIGKGDRVLEGAGPMMQPWRANVGAAMIARCTSACGELNSRHPRRLSNSVLRWQSGLF